MCGNRECCRERHDGVSPDGLLGLRKRDGEAGRGRAGAREAGRKRGRVETDTKRGRGDTHREEMVGEAYSTCTEDHTLFGHHDR